MIDDEGDYLPPEGGDVGINFKTPASELPGGEIPLLFKYIFYRPPPGNVVGLDFPGPYSPPRGGEVGLEFSPGEVVDLPEQYIFPRGSESLEVGSHYSYNLDSYVLPYGWGSGSTSTPSVRLGRRFVRPTGRDFSAYGRPTTRLFHSFAVLTGWESSYVGTPELGRGDDQWVAPTGTQSGEAGVPALRLSMRYVSSLGWISSSFSVGSFVENTSHGISPGGIPRPPDTGVNSYRQVPSPITENMRFVATPKGIPSGTVGRADISNQYRWVDVRGIPPHGVGRHGLSYLDSTIAPPSVRFNGIVMPPVVWVEQGSSVYGWDSFLPGRPRIDINLQTIRGVVGFRSSSYGSPSLRNSFHSVAVRSLGQQSDFGRLEARNFSQSVDDVGLDEPINFAGRGGWISLRDRYSSPQGFLSGRFSPRPARVNLGARTLGPTSVTPPESSRPDISHRDRFLAGTGWESSFFGRYVFVTNSARVVEAVAGQSSSLVSPGASIYDRTIRVSHYNISPFTGYGTPWVSYGTRGFSTVGIRSGAPGPETVVRYNPYPIAPEGAVTTRNFGAAFLRSVRREIGPKPANLPPNGFPGYPAVVNRNRNVRMISKVHSEYGQCVIYNLNVEVSPPSISALPVPRPVIGRRDREVYPRGFKSSVVLDRSDIWNVMPDPPSDSIIYTYGIEPPRTLGAAKVRSNTAYPPGFASYGVGGHQFRSNHVAPKSVTFSEALGVATATNKKRFVDMGVGIPPRNQFGWARLSPYTIYAVVGLSDLAVSNNGGGRFTIVDLDKHRYGWVPKPTLRTPTRVDVRPKWGGVSSRVGSPEVALRLRYIAVTGVRQFRMDRPTVDGGYRFVGPAPLYTGGVGDPRLRIVETPEMTRVVSPGGVNKSVFGAPRVMLFDREVSPRGVSHNATFFGRPLIGFPRSLPAGGDDLLVVGSATVEFVDRTIFPVGKDLGGWNIEDFNHEFYMTTVRLRGFLISPPSLNPSTAGTPDVGNSILGFKPWGIQYGGAGTPDVTYSVTPSGFDSYGAGRPRLVRPGIVEGWGIEAGTLPDPHLSYVVSVYGVPPNGVGEPAMPVVVRPSPVGYPGMAQHAVVAYDCYEQVIPNTTVGDSSEVGGNLWIRSR